MGSPRLSDVLTPRSARHETTRSQAPDTVREIPGIPRKGTGPGEVANKKPPFRGTPYGPAPTPYPTSRPKARKAISDFTRALLFFL